MRADFTGGIGTGCKAERAKHSSCGICCPVKERAAASGCIVLVNFIYDSVGCGQGGWNPYPGNAPCSAGKRNPERQPCKAYSVDNLVCACKRRHLLYFFKIRKMPAYGSYKGGRNPFQYFYSEFHASIVCSLARDVQQRPGYAAENRKTERQKRAGERKNRASLFSPPHVLALTKRDSKAESLAPLASRGVPPQRRSFVFFLEFEYIIVLSGMLMFLSACRFISYIKKRCTELWPRISFRRK